MAHNKVLSWLAFGLAVLLSFPSLARPDNAALTSAFGVELGARSDNDRELGGALLPNAQSLTTAIVPCAAGVLTTAPALAIAVANTAVFDTSGGAAVILDNAGHANAFTYANVAGSTLAGVANSTAIAATELPSGGTKAINCTGNYPQGSRVYSLEAGTNLATILNVFRSAIQHSQDYDCQQATGASLPSPDISAPGRCAVVYNTNGTDCTSVAGAITMKCRDTGSAWIPDKAPTAYTADALTGPLTLCASGFYARGITTAGNGDGCEPASGSGTVTSIGVNMPATEWSTSADIVGAGDITVTKLPQAAHAFYAGPTAGPNAAPTFRAFDPTDFNGLTLPVGISGTAAAATALAGTLTLCPSGQYARGITNAGNGTGCTAAGAGTVTEARLSTTATDLFSISGTPITGNGEFVIAKQNQTQNFIFAGSNGTGDAPPTFRAMAAGDLPATINANTTGNAATATALAVNKPACPANQYATDQDADGTLTCGQPAIGTLSNGSAVLRNDQGNTISTGDQDFSAATSVKLKVGASIVPSASGTIGYDTDDLRWEVGDNGVNKVLAYLDSSITGNAATATKLAAAGTPCGPGEFANGVDEFGTATGCAAPPGGGTVTSVSGASTPTEFSLTGGPIVGAGTLTLDTATQAANKVYAGPTLAPDTKPTFRSLVSADLPAASTSAKGAVELATDGESAANVVVQGNDGRLTNARTPTAHATSHKNGGSDEIATLNPAAFAIPKALGTGKLDTAWLLVGSATGTVAAGDDSRLSNARTPTAHATSHQHGGSDEIAVASAAANAIPKAGADTRLSATWLPALTGDVTTTAGTAATTLATTGVVAGTYTKVTVDAKGRATTGATASAADLSNGTTGTPGSNIVLANGPTLTSPNISKLANLTSNGIVKTSGGDGTLSAGTATAADLSNGTTGTPGTAVVLAASPTLTGTPVITGTLDVSGGDFLPPATLTTNTAGPPVADACLSDHQVIKDTTNHVAYFCDAVSEPPIDFGSLGDAVTEADTDDAVAVHAVGDTAVGIGGADDTIRSEGNNTAKTIKLRAGIFGAQGQSVGGGHCTQVVNIDNTGVASYTTSSCQIPADATVISIPVRVVTAIGGTPTLTVRATTSGTYFQKGTGIATTAGSTDPGNKPGRAPYNGVAQQSVTLDLSANPSDTNGQVRVDIFYETSTPATS